ncbi:uncharacterized protein LOC119591169 isoform X1 [Penaeus monodon]|uniref:uncharacterized protein LOC119591169 isoform X1 n=1 Tax=Penaeus monodon TaxID=6687 RepID=UPI0018A7B430|nr:uncharacterized protein LOC119591169 isoform X1 [Penaeus monodon]
MEVLAKSLAAAPRLLMLCKPCAARPRTPAPTPTHECHMAHDISTSSSTTSSTTSLQPQQIESPFAANKTNDLLRACSTCAQQIAQASSSQHVCSPAHELAPALSNGNGSGMGGGNGRRLNRRTELDFEELMALQMAGDIALIDVRNPKELEKHDAIPGAVNIPLCHLKLALQLSDEEWAREFQVEKPAKCDRNLVFYARGPNASSAAVEIAHRLGFKMSRHYIGGWEEYSKKTGQPLTKSQDPSPFSNYYQNQFDQYFL